MKKYVTPALVVLCVVLGVTVQNKMDNRGEEALIREIKTLGEEIAYLRQSLNAFLTAASGRESRMDDSTDASYIIQDLRTLKSASLMYYADNMDDIAGMDVSVAALTRYLEPKFSSPVYLFTVSEGTASASSGGKLGAWWAGFDLKAAGKSEGVRERLKERANSVGLYAEPSPATAPYTGQDVVWMQAR